ncbi:MAG: class II glutamine amidotransferase [Deltaproteobacteria bacterium]|nr:class II glutamine amidotransferase [Deltaproteobacteria bacterium]
MCRLLGIVSAVPYHFDLVLREAPHSIAMLSREHRDGWGLATHGGGPEAEWSVHRSTLTADDDPTFAELAHSAAGRVLLAHVRKKSVGPLAPENTHPFRSGRWVFAHNGHIIDQDYVRRRTSRARLGERRGDTDSELFFAYLLTCLDEKGVTDTAVSERTDHVVRKAILDAIDRPEFGSLNVLLSNGQSVYVSRFGRTLHLMERVPIGLAVAASPTDGDPCKLADHVPLTQRHCVVVASEPLTDEPWTPVAQGALLRLDVSPQPHWTAIA